MLTSRSGTGPRPWAAKAAISAAALLPVVGAAMLRAPGAAADPAPGLEQAVLAARGGASCAALQHNATVEHAAEIVNRSNYAYLNHSGDNVPIDEPHPTAIAKDLGIQGTKVVSLLGAGRIEADAVKGVILQGYNAIPDCSYTSFGASQLYEEQSGLVLVAVVLVGS